MIYLISDLHGYPLEKLKKLLIHAGFSGSDTLYVLGDVIDRGEEGVETLRWLMNQPNAELLLGNHEAMLLSCDFIFSELTNQFINDLSIDKMKLLEVWQSNGGKQTIKDMLKLLPSERLEIVDYLRECQLFDMVDVGGKDYFLVHAGIGNYRENKKFNDYQSHDFLWVRPYLEDRFSDKFITVFGHTPTVYYGREFKRRVIKTETWIDIDTGASCGLSPTLLRLDDLMAFTYDEQDYIKEYKIDYVPTRD